MRGSREISLVPSLHRASTDALIKFVVLSHDDRHSTPNGTVAGIVVGVIMLILFLTLVVVAVPLTGMMYSKRKRKKQLESMQLDILAM